MTLVKVFWNPGHGGYDSGATANGLKEKDVVLTIAKQADKYLKNHYADITTKMYRSDDTYKSLDAIVNEANQWEADIFVSIHVNSGGGTGFETYIYNGSTLNKTKSNQHIIHAEIMKGIEDVDDRGKKQANFAVLRQTTMPALLTENLFIDTTTDANKLKGAAFLNELSTGHAKGVAKALGVNKKEKEEGESMMEKASPVHTEAWEKAYKKGVMNGENPFNYVTREQIATILDEAKLLDTLKDKR